MEDPNQEDASKFFGNIDKMDQPSNIVDSKYALQTVQNQLKMKTCTPNMNLPYVKNLRVGTAGQKSFSVSNSVDD